MKTPTRLDPFFMNNINNHILPNIQYFYGKFFAIGFEFP